MLREQTFLLIFLSGSVKIYVSKEEIHMKKALSIILAVLMLASALAVNGFADEESEAFLKSSYNAADNLKSYVIAKKTVKTTSSSGDTDTETVKYTTNDKGILTKTVSSKVSSSGYKSSETVNYSYNSAGSITKIDRKGNDSSFTNTITYDKNGNAKSSVSSDGDTGSTQRKYSYDKEGRVTKAVVDHGFLDSDDYRTVVKYSYNENGQLVQETSTEYMLEDPDETGGSAHSVTKYTYYANGRKKTVSTAYSWATYTTTYSYISDGRPSRIVNTVKYPDSSSTAKTDTVYTYNDSGLLTKTVSTETGRDRNTTDVVKYSYNSKGLNTKVTEKYDSGSDYSFTHTGTATYDKYGNKTKTVVTSEYSDGEKVTSEATYTYKKLSSPVCVIGGSFKLSGYKYAYNGKAKTPNVIVAYENENSNESRMLRGVDYTVSYSKNVKPGKAKAIIKYSDGSPSVTITFDIVPAKVTGLKNAKAAKDSIKLSWSKAGGAKYYQVQMSTDGKNWKNVTKATDKTTITVSKLKPGTKYRFRVRALDSTKKQIGAYSSVLKTGTQTAAPKISKLTTKSKSVTVTWGKVTGAKSYIVYKSTDGKTYKAAKSGITKTSYTLTGLKGGKRIYVKVIAVNAYKVKSAYSAAKYITVKK